MIRWALIATALLLVFYLALPALAQDGDDSTLTESQYWDLVEETRNSAAECEQHADQLSSEERSRLLELSERWRKLRFIQIPDGQTLEADHPYLVSLLTNVDPDCETILVYLEALKTRNSTAAAGKDRTGDLTTLEEILNSNEIEIDRVEESRFLKNLSQAIEDFLRKIFPKGEIRVPTLPDLLLAGLGVVVIAVAFAYAARYLRAEWVSDLALQTNAAADEDQLTNSQTAIDKADQLIEAQDRRHAIRYLYLACILGLNERGVIEFDISRTNREFANSFNQTSPYKQPIDHIVSVFDRVWYGYQEISSSQMHLFRETVDKLLQRAQS